MRLRLAQEREAKNWSLRELEKRTGIKAATLSRLERGLMPVYPGWSRRLVQQFKPLSAAELFRRVDEDERAAAR